MSLQEKGAGATPAPLPDWATEALNGASMRVAKPWRREDLSAADFVCGTVAARTSNTLDIAIEAGTLAGEALAAGEWRRVDLKDAAVLARWDKRDEVEVGDAVAIRYLGSIRRPSGWRSHDYACGVYRATTAPWE